MRKILFIILILITVIIIVQLIVADKYTAQVQVIEGEKKVGVNPTGESLDFGDLSPDTTAMRYVTLKAGGLNTYIMIWKFGSIAELIKLNKNNFTMKKGDEEKLEFTLYMPPSAQIDKKFAGYVWIFKLPKIF